MAGYRSDVRNTMKAYRKGTLSAPLVGEAPSSKLEARKFAMESAKSALSNMPEGFEMKYNKRMARVNNKLGKNKPATPPPITPPPPAPTNATPTTNSGGIIPTPNPNPMPPKTTPPPTTNPMPTTSAQGKGKKMRRLGYTTNG